MRSASLVPVLVLAVGCAHVSTQTKLNTATSVGYPPDAVQMPSRAYAGTMDVVWSAASKAITGLGWQVTPISDTEHVLAKWAPNVRAMRAHTPTTFWSWGDSVFVIASPMKDGRVVVGLVSTTSQAVDWGKDRENIERFYAALSNELHEPAAVMAPPGTKG